MKHCKRLISIISILCLLLAQFSLAVQAETADTTAGSADYSYVLNGNSGATVTFTSPVQSASIDDEALATVQTEGSTVTVTALEGAVGIVTLNVTADSDYCLEIPVGYSTFIFNGGSVTAYPGSDTDYSLTGIAAPDTEVSKKNLTDVVTNDDGSTTYGNTDAYSLLVNLPKTGGTYVFSGSGDDMAIAVKKAATADTTILLAGLTLHSELTAPITVKKESTATVSVTALAGTVNALSDEAFNNADIYGDTADGGDGTNTEYAESAVIKGKANAQVILNGKGALCLNCATKNAVKVGEYGSLSVEDVTLTVNSAGHGLSSDNTLDIQSGTLHITAASDGIRSDPDAVDAENGTAGNITITGGTVTIQAGSDGIQAAQDLIISGGTFHITTGSGYNDASFDEDTMSCKGLKASFNTDESTDTSESTNTVSITGGTFYLNCADDAVHSDAYASVTGGQFTIYTGDDGVHADTTLVVGTENGSDSALTIDVKTCYEGLEAGTVDIYSGKILVVSSDDGINAAGGSDSTDNTGGFNPGGGWGGWGGPGSSGSTSTTSNYAINIYGGKILVNASGDGLDSNGALSLNGGFIVVWGAAARSDNEPLDCDGTLSINGATVFAAGSSSMITRPSNSQNYISSSSSVSSGKTVNVYNGSELVFNIAAVKDINYALYSSPDMTSTSGWSFTTDNSTPMDLGFGDSESTEPESTEPESTEPEETEPESTEPEETQPEETQPEETEPEETQPEETQPEETEPEETQPEETQPEETQPEEVETVTVYRLYNQYTHEHLLVTDETERTNLLEAGWSEDGIAWNAPTTGNPVYRLYNPFDDWHMYTNSEEEMEHLLTLGWTLDGPVSCDAGEGGIPVYRLFNPYEQSNYLLFTAGADEIEYLVSLGWENHGIGWFAAE